MKLFRSFVWKWPIPSNKLQFQWTRNDEWEPYFFPTMKKWPFGMPVSEHGWKIPELNGSFRTIIDRFCLLFDCQRVCHSMGLNMNFNGWSWMITDCHHLPNSICLGSGPPFSDTPSCKPVEGKSCLKIMFFGLLAASMCKSRTRMWRISFGCGFVFQILHFLGSMSK